MTINALVGNGEIGSWVELHGLPIIVIIFWNKWSSHRIFSRAIDWNLNENMLSDNIQPSKPTRHHIFNNSGWRSTVDHVDRKLHFLDFLSFSAIGDWQLHMKWKWTHVSEAKYGDSIMSTMNITKSKLERRWLWFNLYVLSYFTWWWNNFYFNLTDSQRQTKKRKKK